MRLEHSLPIRSDCTSARRLKLATATAFSIAFLCLGICHGQISEGTTQPPESPKPRFPQLPDDPPPKTENPIPKVTSNIKPIETVGEIRKIQGRTLTIKHDDPEKPDVFLVSPAAEVTLNHKPAELKDLQVQDFVRVESDSEKPGMVLKVAAARVINDTPPSIPPVRPAVTPRTEGRFLPNRQGGLGIVVSDSPNLGVLILDVHRNTPAWSAGIQIGDYLLQADGKEITTPDEFLATVRAHAPRENMNIILWRDGKTRKGIVELTTREVARDSKAEDGRELILAESHGDDTVVSKRTPGIEPLDRGPEHPHVALDREPDGSAVVIDRDRVDTHPAEYENLARKFRLLQQQVLELERELKQVKK